MSYKINNDKKPESNRRVLVPQTSYQYYSNFVKKGGVDDVPNYISSQRASHEQLNKLVT